MIIQRITINIFLAISLLISCYSCNQHKGMAIEPINEEFNNEYLTGEGLDTNYFNTRDVMQYYQVSNFSSLNADQILARLHNFSMASYPPRKIANVQTLSLLFYKKKLFVDYRDNLYESARENDTRRLFDYSDELLATVTFERIKDDPRKMSFTKIVYSDGKFPREVIDTISVK